MTIGAVVYTRTHAAVSSIMYKNVNVHGEMMY